MCTRVESVRRGAPLYWLRIIKKMKVWQTQVPYAHLRGNYK